MNGELANVIALALHGSAWLARPSAPTPDLERSNSTFQYVGRLQFEPPERRWRGPEPIRSTAAWLSWLRKSGATRIWLAVPATTHGALPPHVASAFANGGQWGLHTTGRRASVWVPTWEVGDRNAADKRIWSVRFAGSKVDSSAAPSRPAIGATAEALKTALVEASHFARTNDLTSWADWFDDAVRRSEGDVPEIPYHPDMAPPTAVGAEALRLLAMAGKSWVFGGMGSWNDVWLEDQAARSRFDEVSGRLYKCMLDAFVAATNAELTLRVH